MYRVKTDCIIHGDRKQTEWRLDTAMILDSYRGKQSRTEKQAMFEQSHWAMKKICENLGFLKKQLCGDLCKFPRVSSTRRNSDFKVNKENLYHHLLHGVLKSFTPILIACHRQRLPFLVEQQHLYVISKFKQFLVFLQNKPVNPRYRKW